MTLATESVLLPLLVQDEASGRRIAIAIGAFRLLHAGSVRFLRAARGESDRLYVALLDAVAPTGQGEPALLRTEERQRILSAFCEVDGVAPVRELLDWHKAAPGAVWFASAAEKDLPESTAAQLKEAGVSVRPLLLHEDCSTSAVLNRMKR